MEKTKLTANILFSGIGCQERGLKNTGLYDVEVISTSDVNKEAILTYAAIHNDLTPEMIESYQDYPTVDEMIKELSDRHIGYDPEKDKPYNWTKHKNKSQHVIKKYWLAMKLSNNLGDISRIKRLDYADLWTISFPCQSISCAGKMKGFAPDSGTRSSLLWENIRLLKKAKDEGLTPKYLMFENVKNLASKKFKDDFMSLLDILNDLSFNTYWTILNAKNCGVPQNRERVFVICIRKDIDDGSFTFPTPFDDGVRLKDILETDVDEKYYLNNPRANELIDKLINDGVLPDEEDEEQIPIDLTMANPKKKLDVPTV